ncbi:MAG: hypothetical protein J6X01_01400 [Bacteroidales bacterium]|nr:hypothetical protein [Bacteroidales bacterium]
MTVDEIVPGKLWAIRYDGDDDNTLVLRISEIMDTQWRWEFLKAHEKQLSYYHLSIQEASSTIFQELIDIIKVLYKDTYKIDDFFHPLNDTEVETDQTILLKNKGYLSSDKGKRLLRVYALKLEPSYYVITGCVIKLTKSMQDSENTMRELKNLDKCRDFLISSGVYDLSSFLESKTT